MLDKLKLLDPLDDKSWTADGLPAISAVKTIMSDETITRADINKVAFGLTRDNVTTWQSPVAAVVEVAVVATAAVVITPTEDDLEPQRAAIQALRDKSSRLQGEINAATLALHETDAKLKALEAKLPENSDPNHHANAYAEYMQSVQAHKLALAEQGLLRPAPIDLARRRHDSDGRRFR